MDMRCALERKVCLDETAHGEIFEGKVGGNLVDEVVEGLLGSVKVLEKGGGVGGESGMGGMG